MTVETVLEGDAWAGAGLDALAARAAAAALRHLGHDPEAWDISVLGCDDARIAALNADFRGRPAPTNVLSWPSAERAAPAPGARPLPPDPAMPELGDIAIAHETCLREARAAALPMSDHVTHLLVHATLHLLGYDHETGPDADLMEGLEIEILATLGVANPY